MFNNPKLNDKCVSSRSKSLESTDGLLPECLAHIREEYQEPKDLMKGPHSGFMSKDLG